MNESLDDLRERMWQATIDDAPLRCGWPRRWWHRRQRRADERFLRPALQRQALTPDHAARAWTFFKQNEDHWNCQCALEELRDQALPWRRRR